MNKKLLIVEDSSSLRRILDEILTSKGYDVTSAENGRIAFEILQKEEFPVVITDLEMPVMLGDELIDKMMTLTAQPVVIVLTSHDDSNRIIDIMRKGVFDYMIKPVKKADLFISIERAFRVSELNRLQKITEKEKMIRLEHQLEWYKFLERQGHKGGKTSESLLFENLQRSLNQGSGLGAMFSLVELLTATAVKKGDVYEIEEKILNQLIDNQRIVYEAMIIFSEIEKISINPLKLEPVSIKQLYESIGAMILKMKPLEDIHGHSLLLCDEKTYFGEIIVEINLEYLLRVVREMLINAMKFSEQKTSVYVILEKDGGDMVISVINNTKSITDDGIPMEYENIVFEPFFRKVKYIEDRYQTLDYGLGLTLSEKIIQRHNGRISIYNIQDYSDISKNPLTKVNCRITLPIIRSGMVEHSGRDVIDEIPLAL
ncbi:MAG: response regulator [Spirochaetes bacterium]|nr:response regulator [Spirochaetota bacterium]